MPPRASGRNSNDVPRKSQVLVQFDASPAVGCPAGASITDIARLKLTLPTTVPGKSIADIVAETWIEAAVDGDTQLLKELIERLEGKVPPARVASQENDTIKKIDELLAAIDEAAENNKQQKAIQS